MLFVVEERPVIGFESNLLQIIGPEVTSTFGSCPILSSLLNEIVLLVFENMKQIVIEKFLKGRLVLLIGLGLPGVLLLPFVWSLAILVRVD